MPKKRPITARVERNNNSFDHKNSFDLTAKTTAFTPGVQTPET